MELAAAIKDTVGAYAGQRGATRIPSAASPEEGLRLVSAFVRVERSELREAIISYIEEILRRQGGG